ncbi:hypothetical protein GQ600_456 [Phytophthora cactorum]|nr:hypothetical protein GQ600_456 [Phytophthora cactorum]
MPGYSPVIDSLLPSTGETVHSRRVYTTAQSNNRCKTHGGGARCQVEGCDKSSQGGGLCRAHGGGKKCRIPGCSKGTQRLGLCYLHGGIRRCIMEGCKKKDRGKATASRTEVVGGARLRTAIGQFARGTTANYTKVELKTPRSRLVGPGPNILVDTHR